MALQHLGDPLYFKLKGHRDVMVGASLKVQDTIRDVLLAGCPDDAFMGEEGPDDEELPIAAERLWVIDPIDGSINYFQGLPLFAISIYWHLPVLIVIVSIVYSATRSDNWRKILHEALSWGLRLGGFLVGIGVVLYIVATLT